MDKCKYCGDKLQDYAQLKERGYCYKLKCIQKEKRNKRKGRYSFGME